MAPFRTLAAAAALWLLSVMPITPTLANPVDNPLLEDRQGSVAPVCNIYCRIGTVCQIVGGRPVCVPVGETPCGKVTCAKGQICCSPSCGICGTAGGLCPQIVCNFTP
ncbi:hypothetical protein B0H63DRAFT_447312 [Podospora didyma]|uniref:Uncharacterized protein n=1 Tax=Podospora didyma TaxID=330526 RepID=A0AAE0P120_9PEZI|nr:hypothetical protein B0H63DRAFT_447312 [Podospora didyma]